MQCRSQAQYFYGRTHSVGLQEHNTAASSVIVVREPVIRTSSVYRIAARMRPCTVMAKVDLLLVVAVAGSGLRGAAAAVNATANAAAAAEARNDHIWKYIQIHAWLMWASMGFLFPLGAILVRFNRPLRDSNAVVSPARASLLLYLHGAVQCMGVVAATAGIAVLIKEFGATFDHIHMQMGLALWIIVMMMPVISLVRPAKGTTWRQYWLFLHWFLGTGVLVLGIVDCYIGIKIYQKVHGSVKALNIAFSVQVAVMALVYFMQDRFSYIVGQGSKEISRVHGTNHHNMKSDFMLATI